METPKLLELRLDDLKLKHFSTGDDTVTQAFPASLLSVKFNRCNFMYNPQLVNQLVRCCPNLNQLTVAYPKPRLEVSIPPMKYLEHLDLSYHIEISEINFLTEGDTVAFPALSSLDLTENVFLRSINIVSDSKSATQHFPSLALLNLSDCWRGDVPNLLRFCSHSKSLRTVHASALPAKIFGETLRKQQGPHLDLTGLVDDDVWSQKRISDSAKPTRGK